MFKARNRLLRWFDFPHVGWRIEPDQKKKKKHRRSVNEYMYICFVRYKYLSTTLSTKGWAISVDDTRQLSIIRAMGHELERKGVRV